MNQQAENITRPTAAALDAILGKKFRVLDDGFIRLIDYMGSDGSIVQAARVSYGEGTKHVQEDRGLIRYLMRHRHSTPFEMCEIKLHIRVPMDCWRQWIRHRTANVNEYSTRYSVAIDSMQQTQPDEWRLQASSNRQGSAGLADHETGEQLTADERKLHQLSRDIYDKRLELGLAREQARKDLPLSTYTEAYWKVDLHNLLHFLALRMDEHAQFEIRNYARTIGEEIVRNWVPLTWEAFLDYRFNAMQLSGPEVQLMNAINGGDTTEVQNLAQSFGWLNKRDDGSLKRNREREEFEAKLAQFNMKLPW
jgi:thymidylate synthase (FAD)